MKIYYYIKKRTIYMCNNRKLYYYIITTIFFALFNKCVLFAENVPESLCGPLSLLSISKHFGISSSLEEIKSFACYDTVVGTTMLGLYNAALKIGLPAVPLRIKIDQLCSYKAPSIAFVDGNHFLVVHGCKGDKVIIQYPPGLPYPVTKESFKKKWHGETLVFDKKQKKKMAKQIEIATAPQKGSHIHISETTYDAGTVNEGTKLSHTFSFSNIGTDSLIVTARSTCNCTATLLSDKNIPPGGSGNIKVEYNTTGRTGKTKQGTLIRTNDPDNPLVNLTIVAMVKSSVKVVPEKVWLDEVVIGGKFTREILVIDSGDSTLKVESVKTPEGITGKILPERNENFRSIPVQLTIDSGIKLGKFEKSITIKTNDKKRPEITVSISGIVLGELKALPPIVFFGETKKNTRLTREINLAATAKKPIPMPTVKNRSSNITTALAALGGGAGYRLAVTLNAPSLATTIRDTLMVYMNGNVRPELLIPVYARIVGQ